MKNIVWCLFYSNFKKMPANGPILYKGEYPNYKNSLLNTQEFPKQAYNISMLLTYFFTKHLEEIQTA